MHLGGDRPRPLLAGVLPPVRRLDGRPRLLGDPPLPGARGRDAPGAARHQRVRAGAARCRRTAPAIPLRARMLAALPLINLITGLVVAALTSIGAGSAALGVDVLVAVAVATTISLELTVLFSKSILRPIADLAAGDRGGARGPLRRLGAGHDRRRARRARRLASTRWSRGSPSASGSARRSAPTSTSEVAEYILSEGFSEDGVEVEVSVLFCDVRDFTRFAAGAEAQEVVARAERAVRGRRPDHRPPRRPRRQVRGRRPAGRVRRAGAVPRPRRPRGARRLRDGHHGELATTRPPLKIGVGVNSGRVVAGSIGGAGRLNFSVIGDAVNVAARVEAATRELEEDVLITEATRAAAELGDRGRGLRRARPAGDRRAGGAVSAADRRRARRAARRGAPGRVRGTAAAMASSGPAGAIWGGVRAEGLHSSSRIVRRWQPAT